MRVPMLVTAAVLLLSGAKQSQAAPTLDMPLLVTASALQDPQPQPTPQPSGGDVKVDVDLDRDGTVWYTDPLWIVLGAAAVIVVVALVAAASRGPGGGTTVIK